MKISVKDNSETNKTLTITLDKKDMKSEIDKQYDEVSQKAKIPGFRKGHVPKPIIDKQYGAGYALSLALEKIVSKAYFDVVEKNNLKPLTEPKIDITQYPDPAKEADYNLSFTATLETRPKIDLPNLKELEIKIDKILVSADDIMKKLESMQHNYATLKAVDRKADIGDYVSLNMKSIAEDKLIDQASGISYQVGSNTMVPGLDDQLKGLKANSKKTFETVLDKGQAAGKKAKIDIEVLSVKTQEFPPLDDEFAKLVSEHSKLVDLKKDLKKEVLEDKKRLQVDTVSQKFLEKLNNSINVNVPEVVIKDTVKRHIDSLKQKGQEVKEADKKKLYDSILEDFKISFILDALGEKLDVKISKEEFSNYVVNLAMRYNMPPEQFLKIMEQTGQISGVLRELGQSKTVHRVLEIIKVVDTDGKVLDIKPYLKNQPKKQIK
ncbi:MAG: trigger factor [Bifidobacteriaceae bacterium]|jgi:trigger factor|nr:trigger factor [Bifidobacteriaceae bacterium]